MEISENVIEETSQRAVNGFKRPTEEFINKCGLFLEKRGWLRSIAGDVNFRKGAEGWAKAIDRWKTFFKMHFDQCWMAYRRDFSK